MHNIILIRLIVHLMDMLDGDSIFDKNSYHFIHLMDNTFKTKERDKTQSIQAQRKSSKQERQLERQ